MNQIEIYDPPMCCSTGVCGPSVNPELLRVFTVINNLIQKGACIQRYNLSQNPNAFIKNPIIHQLLNKHGHKILPVTVVNNQVIKMSTYMTNDEFIQYSGTTIK